jgi:MFS family permease
VLISVWTSNLNGLRLYYGWIIVALAFLAALASYGLLYAYSVFVPTLVEELSLDRATAAAPMSFCIPTYALLSLVTGRLTDRFGPRVLLLCSGTLLVAGYGVLSQATAPWHLFVGMTALVGVGMSACYIPISATIVRWFVARRGTALAIFSMGAGISISVGPALALALINWLGWRDAFWSLGLIGGGLVVVSAFGMRRDPGESSQTPGSAGAFDAGSWTLQQARRTRAFWVLCAIYFLTWGVMFFPYAHLVSFAGDLGHDAATGVWLISTAGVAGLLARPGIGLLFDRFGRTVGLIVMLALQALACAIFAFWQDLVSLYVASCLFGAGASAGVTIYPAVVSNLFGRAYVGTIAGFAFAFTCSAGFLGPLLAGWMRDTTGTYDLAFVGGAVANLLAIGLALALRTPVLVDER